MYLRIVRPIPARELEGYDVSRYQMHVTYEVDAPLCDLLVMHGFAVPETHPFKGPERRAVPRGRQT